MFECLVYALKSKVHKLLHPFGWPVSTSHTRFFAPRGKANETIRKPTSVAVHSELGITAAKNNAASA